MLVEKEEIAGKSADRFGFGCHQEEAKMTGNCIHGMGMRTLAFCRAERYHARQSRWVETPIGEEGIG